MINRPRLLIAPVIVLAAASIVGCVMMKPIGEITLIETSVPVGNRQVGTTVPPHVEVTAYVTGWVKAPANILIDQSDPRTPPALNEPQWVPSLAFAVAHPEFGVAILDSGLRAGDCEYGLRPIYWVPCRNEPGADLVSQLIVDGVSPNDIRYVVPSHFHGDHISGLSDLLDYSDVTVLATNSSVSDVRSSMRFIKGIPTSMIAADMSIQIIDDGFVEDELGIPVYDVFGDGALKLFRTPGHTNGHVSAIARGSARDIVFSFDAAHLKANFDLGIPSGAVSSRDSAVTSLETVRSVVSSLDNAVLIFGHEPNQWNCVDRSARLDLSSSLCES